MTQERLPASQRLPSLRLFVALDPPPDALLSWQPGLAELRRCAPGARWVPPEALHLTLKFLGTVAPERMAPITAALAAVHGTKLRMEWEGLGAFPSRRRPLVLWAGVRRNPELERLAAAVEAALVPLGIAAEARPWSPHLTLARAQGNELWPLRERLSPTAPHWGPMTAEAFYLYWSRPGGAPSYERLARFALPSPSGARDESSGANISS